MADEQANTDLAIADRTVALPAPSSHLDSTSTLNSGASNSSMITMETARRLMLAASVLIGVLLVFLLVLWIQQPQYRPLGSYLTDELIPVLDHLDQQKILYRLEGNTVLVPDDEYAQIKLNLTRSGLNTTQEAGDEILMEDMGFGVSQQVERERLKLSRERQLASAIEKIQAVSNARVLLAMPKRSVFVRHHQDASATVFLTVRGMTQLGQEEIDSIVDMVSSAVPNLKPSRVTVTDQHGRLLSSGNQDPMTSQRRKEYELERQQEQLIQQKIDTILLPVLGLGNFTAQVDVSMDFSAEEETKKHFDPANPVPRSEFSREDINSADLVGGIPGALSNQPPADAAIPQVIEDLKTGRAEGSLSRESTKNFEIDTTISYRRSQTGTIARQTVSVAVDYLSTKNPETGEVTRTPVAEEELAKIKRLVMGGIGFSETRGDVLEVISMSFVAPPPAEIIDLPFWQHPNFNDWVRWVAAALVMIVVVFTLVRPALLKLLNPIEEEKLTVGPNGEMFGADGLPYAGDDDIGLIGSDLDGSDNFNIRSSVVALPELHKDEDLLKAVRALVANEPELASQVIKSWLDNNG